MTIREEFARIVNRWYFDGGGSYNDLFDSLLCEFNVTCKSRKPGKGGGRK